MVSKRRIHRVPITYGPFVKINNPAVVQAEIKGPSPKSVTKTQPDPETVLALGRF
jgi:hypothetical protein